MWVSDASSGALLLVAWTERGQRYGKIKIESEEGAPAFRIRI